MPLTKDKYFELIDSNSDYPHFRCALGAYIPGSLYKYFSIPDDSDEARKRFEQLKSGEIWFSKRSGLNDPFEFEHIALKGAQNDARQYYLNKQQELEVCCFSALLYNKLMWSHYAAGYKGYCVEFRVESPERFYPVIYENEVPDLSQEYQRFYDMRNEMCANPSLVLNNYENRKVLLRINYPLFSKDTCWSYEEEYRILDSSTVSNGELQQMTTNGLRVTKIIAGAFCTDLNFQRLKEVAGALNAKMFEEEYENVVGQMQRQFGDDAYLHYLDGIDVHKTHQGYFSIDKKKGKKARFVEGKIDRKTQLSDDVDAYDLIMKDKERLLSLDEPVRFIFSHSALREGWDNPNVFQICTLKPQSESEIRSRQEIGRGLRLCVNQQGERMDESVLGRDVQELNKLTLITDLEYGKFAEALQTGLAESLADRPQKVDTQLFVGRTLVDANGEQVHVTQDLANAIYEDLIQNDYVKRGKLTDKYFADKEIGSFHVASEVSGYADSVVRILSGVYDAHTMAPENAHSNNVQAIVDEEKLHKAEFLNLWNRINHKSFYTVQFDTPELIDHSIRALDSKLNVTRVQINLEYGEQTARLESREQLEQGKGFQKARSDRESAKYAPLGSVRYDLVGKLVEETGLTRATVAAILRGIAPQTFSQFRINPEEFILKAARLINDEKATQIIEHITYNRLDAAYDQDVFTRATLRGKLDVNAMEANRSLYSHVIYDSDNERRFAQELDVSDQVAVYVKLPGSFYISTPVGKYNPDWAIAFNEGSVKHIYFVAETKGNLDTMELRGVENAKIECAKKHFAAISNGSVVYSVVDNYSTLMQLVSN